MFSTTQPLDFSTSLAELIGRNQLQTLKTTGSQARPSDSAPNPVAAAGSLTAPQHVQNVQVQVQRASDITTKVTVTYQRNPQDYLFVDTRVFVSGYKGNPSPTQVASGISPVSFSLENTGEPVAVTVQSSGNLGQAPLSTAPTATLQLAKTALATTPTTAGNGPGSATFQTQGVDNLSQTLLNIEAIDSSIYVTNPSGGNVAIQGTQFELTSPGWWSSGDGTTYGFNTALGGAYGTGNANEVKWWMSRIPYSLSVGKIATLVSVNGTAGQVGGFAVYDKTGTTKLLAYDNFSVATTGLRNTTITPVVLQPGIYIFASACSQASAGPASQPSYQAASTSEGISPWSANGTKRSGTAANAMSSGVMPSSLGALSVGGGGFAALPYVLMEP